MTGPAPQIAVVVATKDREGLLRKLLDSLEAQTIGRDAFEVVVVDDGATDGTAALLAERERAGALGLRVLRHDSSVGPSQARDRGWRAARAPLVAFTDDDCEADPGWLRALVDAQARTPGAVVMGRTDPDPADAHRISPFTRQIQIHRAGPPYETCNILYPRSLLERLDGFDLTYPKPGGEDTDLGWRAAQAGAPVVYAPEALVFHAVVQLGPVGKLRFPLRWTDTIPVFKRHPGLRAAQLHRGVFWSPIHEHLLLAVLAALLPRRAWPLALLLAAPYLRRLTWRRSGPLLAPYLLLHDLIEVYAVLRGALRARVLVL